MKISIYKIKPKLRNELKVLIKENRQCFNDKTQNIDWLVGREEAYNKVKKMITHLDLTNY